MKILTYTIVQYFSEKFDPIGTLLKDSSLDCLFVITPVDEGGSCFKVYLKYTEKEGKSFKWFFEALKQASDFEKIEQSGILHIFRSITKEDKESMSLDRILLGNIPRLMPENENLTVIFHNHESPREVDFIVKKK